MNELIVIIFHTCNSVGESDEHRLVVKDTETLEIETCGRDKLFHESWTISDEYPISQQLTDIEELEVLRRALIYRTQNPSATVINLGLL